MVKNEIILHPVLLYTEDQSPGPSDTLEAIDALLTALLVIIDVGTVGEDCPTDVGVRDSVVPVPNCVVRAFLVCCQIELKGIEK